MRKNKTIEQELEELISFVDNGGGFGGPDAEAQHERKIQLLMHKQLQAVNKRNSNIALANLGIAFLNIGVLIFQIFFK
jgi:hypothetical protein